MPRGIPNIKSDPAPDAVEPEPVEDDAIEPEREPEPDEAPAETEAEAGAERHESFEATRPDGTVVVVDRNIDTGEQTVTNK